MVAAILDSKESLGHSLGWLALGMQWLYGGCAVRKSHLALGWREGVPGKQMTGETEDRKLPFILPQWRVCAVCLKWVFHSQASVSPSAVQSDYFQELFLL